MSNEYTDADKFDEATRELGMRLRHYPKWIASGTLTHQLAEFRIGVMRAIAQDYKERAAQQQLKLEA